MKDERIVKLAHNLLNYSCKLQKGQSIIIEASVDAKDLVKELVRQTYQIGAYPFVRLSDGEISREIMMGMTEVQAKKACEYTLPMFEGASAYIGISSPHNKFESSDVPDENKKIYSKFYSKPVHMDTRVCKTNWVILNYPNPALAQLAQMPSEVFEDFFFDVCTLNYSKMDKAMQHLKKLMEKTDKVRLVAKDTDLTFSIKGQPAVICSGSCNIPDGEIYTSPLKTSINGKIHFNIPSLHKGIIHDDITLEFKDGKVINETSSHTAELTAELNVDEGARYVGEFSFGVNPYITKPMYDTVFDEKISGSIHMALGNAYDDAPNGNHSQNHWDIVLSMRPEYNGGQIYFDDVLIRDNGLFVLPELKCLNPENLK